MKNHSKIFWFTTFHKKTLMGAKPLCIRFDKIDGFIRVYDGTRYLVLFMEQWCSGKGTGFPIQGSQVKNHWVAPRSTQHFVLLSLIK